MIKDMKKNIIKLLFTSMVITSAIISCSEVTDPLYLGYIEDEDVAENSSYAYGILDKVYDNINDEDERLYGIEDDYYTDNAVYNSYEQSYATGNASASNYPVGLWDFHYLNIVHVNKFLYDNVVDLPYSRLDTAADYRDTEVGYRYGEAHFLRAWSESELLKQYGGPTDAAKTQMMGIPMLRDIYDADEIVEVERASFDDCVQMIINDLDTAIKYCPFKYDGSTDKTLVQGKGRATQRTAKALKARVLLLAASPAFNISGETSKWMDAALAADAAILMDGGLDDLGTLEDENVDDHDDVIWKTEYSKANNMESTYFPPSFYGNGECNPSQNLVNSFPMADGTPITESDEYNAYNPYESRDERFEKFIIHDGELLYDYKVIETYVGGDDAIGGLRTDATRTSYYMQRFTVDAAADGDPRVSDGKSDNGGTFVRLLDRQEVYLNYVEAVNELETDPLIAPAGLNYSAYEVFQKVKIRGGANALTYTDSLANNGLLTQDVFREIIKNERRIEFCFRGFRYWDMRRWMEPMTVINAPVEGLTITRDVSSGVELVDYATKDVEQRNYPSNTYYGPLPYSEVAKSKQLIQNYGW